MRTADEPAGYDTVPGRSNPSWFPQALRTAGPAAAVTGPDDRFGGDEFEYGSSTDLFRCTECRVYEGGRTGVEGCLDPAPATARSDKAVAADSAGSSPHHQDRAVATE